MSDRTAIIIGAGPAGLTAAYELLEKTEIKTIIYEMTGDVGGISKTVNYKGNRIDIGGHRFFSKSDKVIEWWRNFLPLQGAPSKDDIILGRSVPPSRKSRVWKSDSKNPGKFDGPDPEKTDGVMLIRTRLSRIFLVRKFFDYPVSLNLNTLSNLGIRKILKIVLSYIKIRLFPIRNEKTLQDFFINRFGKQLYLIFFKGYTEKVWGITCDKIKPEWGIQRIKGLSFSKALLHAVNNIFFTDSSITQKNTETSLIGYFMYPKFGPGQMWEEVSKNIREKGGELYLSHRVVRLRHEGNMIVEAEVRNETTGGTVTVKGSYFLSTMPVKELIECLGESVPEEVRRVAQGLIYRDFITVGLLLKKLKITNNTRMRSINNIIPDNWIYVQDKDVKLGRLQIYNNWSPYLVKDGNNVWIGLEYFCNEGDELWNKSDGHLARFAVEELARIGIIEEDHVLDFTIIRMPKAYPAYFGSYERFELIRRFTERFENLFLMGRNGMHRYNNQDHSMLTAMASVENIIKGVRSKDNIWNINTEREYYETKRRNN